MTDILQGTDEWRKARLGKITASRISDVMAKGKNGAPSATRANYMADLIAERLTGVPIESYTSKEMERGTLKEPDARAAYEFFTDCVIESVGFIPHPTIKMAGASPDGFVGKDGIVQFKCPLTKTHIETLLGKSIPNDYLLQVQWEMACSERDWCDFTSFDDRLPPRLQKYTRRIPRDDLLIEKLEEAVMAFDAEIEEKVSALLELT
jgi:putative phage-type endonuclease